MEMTTNNVTNETNEISLQDIREMRQKIKLITATPTILGCFRLEDYGDRGSACTGAWPKDNPDEAKAIELVKKAMIQNSPFANKVCKLFRQYFGRTRIQYTYVIKLLARLLRDETTASLVEIIQSSLQIRALMIEDSQARLNNFCKVEGVKMHD